MRERETVAAMAGLARASKLECDCTQCQPVRIDDPYEPPEAPDLAIDTTNVPLTESISRIIARVTTDRESLVR
jgi:hypothetical protein